MNRTVKVIGLSIACVLFAQGGCVIAAMEWQRRAIPAKLETGLFYAEGGCGDALSYQGAQVFSLKTRTIAALKSNGLSFFDDIDASANRAPHTYFGGKWQKTPITDATKPDGSLYLMHCAMNNSWRWPAGIPEAIQRTGGFYQTGGGCTLIVLPEQGYVVAIASDR
ncbi:hypothetical protein OSJ57_26490 [Sphingomonas sp. HH69]